MRVLIASCATPARRAALCALALLALTLGSTAAAGAADGETGTIVVQQRAVGGSPAPGGCYAFTKVGAPNDGFWGYRCDREDSAGTDGRVVAELPVGTYRLEEDAPPPAFKTAPGTFSATVGAGETVTVTRTHEPLPPLRVVTNGTDGKPVAGSCWRIHLPGEYEGYIADACDDDDGADDGTTTFTTIRPGSYEVRHMDAPSPFHRLDEVTPFAMPDAEKTLTFGLEREIAPVNTAPPTVTGQAKVGEALAGDRGTWTGTYIEFVDSWQRCNGAGANCLTIDGSFGESHYTLTTDDLGTTLRFAVTGRNEAGRVVAVSAPVQVLSLDAPANTSRPTITGAVEPGQRLTGNPGTWTGAPAFAFQWQHCATDGIACTNVDRATGSTYALTTGDTGFRMRLVVTATNDAGSATATSDATSLPNAAPRNQEQPTIRGNAEVGEQLTAYPGWWISHYGALQFDYRWLRCKAADTTDCAFIDGASGDVYTVTPADQGSRIRIDVTGTDAGGSASARSNPTLAVPSAYPVNTSAPLIAGEPIILAKLVATAGVWTSNYGAIKLEYYWDRCNADGTGCEYLHTGRNHTAGTKDIGHVLRVMFFASNTKGTSMAVAQTEVIRTVPPVNVSPPSLVGDPVVSERLTVNPGSWTSPYGDKVTVNFYWSRCNADVSGCDYLHTGRNHTLEPQDIGHVMSVMLSIETDHGVAITHVQSPVVHSAPPTNGSPPSIAGDPVVSERLTVNPGAWSSPYGDKVTVNYYWSRCNADATGCEYLHTGRNHNLEPQDIGHVMRVMLSVETDHGVSIDYVQTPGVRTAPPVNVGAPSLGGDAVLPERLTVSPGTWRSPYGDAVTVNYYWSRCNADGTGCDYLHTGRNHTVDVDDLGHALRVMLSVETDHGVTITYVQSAVVHSVAPVNVTAPSITRQGSKLTVNPGTWTNPYPGGITVNYYWSRCDANGNGCDYLHTGNTHTLGRDDVGHVMRVMLSVETSHGVAIAYVQSAVVS